VDLPTYLYGSREDHIVPITGAYASVKHLPGKKRFVMGASGHIAGVINPPSKNKRSYWTNDKLPATLRAVAGRRQGASRQLVDRLGAWLKPHAGKQIAAPKTYGKAQSTRRSSRRPAAT
jgi:polyhydroxyalkanoate synthase